MVGLSDTVRRPKRAWRNEVSHGRWIGQTEGAKCRQGMINGLKTRGVKDLLLAAVDGLTVFPEAISAVFPKTEVPPCMVRNPVRFVPYKDRRAIIAGLKPMYLAPPAELAAGAPDSFAAEWNQTYPMIARSWRHRWTEVIPCFRFSPEIRKAV